MKEKKFSFKYLLIGLLAILVYFLFSNLLMVIIYEYKPTNRANIKALYYLIVYTITLLLFIFINRKILLNKLKDFQKNYKKYIPKAFNYWLKGYFIMIVTNYILNYLLKTGQSVNELENIALLKNNLLAHSITIILIAPFLEELVFRLSFNKISNNKHIFSFITGTIFGFIHIISSLSLKNPLNILLLIPYSAMGIALGYAYKETNNIFTSLIMHITHNLISLLIIILSIKGGII